MNELYPYLWKYLLNFAAENKLHRKNNETNYFQTNLLDDSIIGNDVSSGARLLQGGKPLQKVHSKPAFRDAGSKSTRYS